jgi:transposase InsO family protein
VQYLIRDRDGKYPARFDTVLADAGINVVLSGVRMPCMNAVRERWMRTCRRELLDPDFDLQPAAPAARAT